MQEKYLVMMDYFRYDDYFNCWFAMMWNPAAGIISINAAVIFVNIIGFISVSPVFIFGMIGISIITIILLKHDK